MVLETRRQRKYSRKVWLTLRKIRAHNLNNRKQRKRKSVVREIDKLLFLKSNN
jgi:hypothetical protein